MSSEAKVDSGQPDGRFEVRVIDNGEWVSKGRFDSLAEAVAEYDKVSEKPGACIYDHTEKVRSHES